MCPPTFPFSSLPFSSFSVNFRLKLCSIQLDFSFPLEASIHFNLVYEEAGGRAFLYGFHRLQTLLRRFLGPQILLWRFHGHPDHLWRLPGPQAHLSSFSDRPANLCTFSGTRNHLWHSNTERVCKGFPVLQINFLPPAHVAGLYDLLVLL